MLTILRQQCIYESNQIVTEAPVVHGLMQMSAKKYKGRSIIPMNIPIAAPNAKVMLKDSFKSLKVALLVQD